MDPAVWVAVTATFLSGFFALTSFSLRYFSRAKFEDRFRGDKGRRRLDLLDRHLASLRLMLSLCRSLANLMLVAAVVYALGQQGLNWGRLAVSVALAGGIIAVFGVAIPHAWALYSAERVLSATLYFLITLRYLLWPITAVMMVFDLPIRRLSGLRDEDEPRDEAAKQEILQAASEGQAEGAVDAEEVDMIESVMEFGDTDTAEIMTPRTDIFALPADMHWARAVEFIHQAGHTRVPIYQNNLDNIVGVVYAKDLLHHVGRDSDIRLEAIARKPFFVPETKPLNDLLREFKARKVHLAIVLDEYGGTAGLVTIEDVLEEIVGDISDEYDKVQDEPVRRIDDTTVEVGGRLRVNELNDLLDLELPEEEGFDTVAGFVVSHLGYIPRADETFIDSGAEFTVLQADPRRIVLLRVRKLPDMDEEA